MAPQNESSILVNEFAPSPSSPENEIGTTKANTDSWVLERETN